LKQIVVLAPKVEKKQILMACCPGANKAKSA
jgi:hypothetical protein